MHPCVYIASYSSYTFLHYFAGINWYLTIENNSLVNCSFPLILERTSVWLDACRWVITQQPLGTQKPWHPLDRPFFTFTFQRDLESKSYCRSLSDLNQPEVSQESEAALILWTYDCMETSGPVVFWRFCVFMTIHSLALPKKPVEQL